MTTEPRLGHRPSYAQREAYREAVNDAYAEGRLDDAEFADRSARADTAHLLRDLEDLVADVPRDQIPRPLKANQLPGTSAAARGLGSGASGTDAFNSIASGLAGSRRPRRIAGVLAVAAVCAGTLVGSVVFHRPGADGLATAASALSTDLDGAADAGFLSYGYIKGVLDQLGDKRIAELDFNWTSAGAQVVTAGGKAARGVEFDKDLHQSDDSRGTTAFRADEADFKSFGATDLKPAVLYAAIQQAPGLVAKRADGVKADELRSAFAIVRRTESVPALGQKKHALTIRVMVQHRDSGDGSNAGSGTVEWSADGTRLLGVSLD